MAGDSLFDQVKAYTARRNACPRHYFPPLGRPYTLGERLLCAHCVTEFRLHEAGTYLRGYIAAGGDPADVWPDYVNNAEVVGD
jgi:hypothetical protein